MDGKKSRLDRLTLLYNVGRSLAVMDELGGLLDRIVEHAAEVMEAHASSLMLVDDARTHLVFQVAHGEKAPQLQGLRLPINDQSVAGKVALTGEPLTVDDVRQVSFFSGQVDRTTNFQTRSILCVPLRGKSGLIGVIEVLNKTTGERFTEDDVDLLTALAGSAAVAIENARLYEEQRRRYDELQRTYRGTLHALSSLLDTRDASTQGHSQRVVYYTLMLTHALGITDAEQLKVIEYGALLHDVGKVGVPDAILHKTGALTPDEWEQMRKHPEIGYQSLADIDFLRPAIPIVRYHHEHWDGTGYPAGLAGEAIPLEARIFALADVFDALTSARPYKPALSFEQAATTIRAGRGTHFDPRVVDAFLSIPAAEWGRVREIVSTGLGDGLPDPASITSPSVEVAPL